MEEKEEEVHVSRGSGNNCDNPEPPDGSEGSGPQDDPDLKSVLVTSVLNLEQLDVDLYR